MADGGAPENVDCPVLDVRLALLSSGGQERQKNRNMKAEPRFKNIDAQPQAVDWCGCGAEGGS